MLMRLSYIFSLFIIFNFSSIAQNSDGFKFHRSSKKRYKINFINYNNLIIIEGKLNGTPMNFLLDTGVDKTVLFGIEGDEELIKKNSQKILISGVSGKKKAYAYKNENNTVEIEKFKDNSHDIYVIFDKDFNISDKIGYQVQGILGYDFFKNHVIKIDYEKNYVKVFNSKKNKNSFRKYQSLDLFFFKQKPYIKANLNLDDDYKEYIFLLDIGSGDAIWVKPQPEQELPEKGFDDILGYGFADIIPGVRSKANSFRLGSTVIDNPKVAFPDSLSYEGLKFIPKSGVIGAEIMRRFNWVFDYTNNKVYFRANQNISDVFNYDMSGLILRYDGYQIIADYKRFFSGIKVTVNGKSSYEKSDLLENKIKVEKKPILKVGAVRPNSSAFDAGFVEGDEIVKINGKKSYNLDFEQITKLLSSEEGVKVNFKIIRNGSLYDKSLILKSRFLE